MKLEELRKLINEELPKLEKNPNSFEYASKCKEAARASYALEYSQENWNKPELYLLEKCWQSLIQEYPNPELQLDRDKKDDTPLLQFMGLVRSGIYPPPEIMLSLLQCFDLYFLSAGKKSLDEVFFGHPHKNKSSQAFEMHQFYKYISFGLHFDVKKMMPGTGLSLKGKSMVERAELYLQWTNPNNTETDPESFLKGYRRWRKTVKKQV
jgi:hypothetical protein